KAWVAIEKRSYLTVIHRGAEGIGLVVVVGICEAPEEACHQRTTVVGVPQPIICILKLVSVADLGAKFEGSKVSGDRIVSCRGKSCLQIQLWAVVLADLNGVVARAKGIERWIVNIDVLGNQFWTVRVRPIEIEKNSAGPVESRRRVAPIFGA